jgi:hypothetical protein
LTRLDYGHRPFPAHVESAGCWGLDAIACAMVAGGRTMGAVRRDPDHDVAGFPQGERRHVERLEDGAPSWIGQRVGTSDEVRRLKELLVFSAGQMAELRSRNEQLMAMNSDLRCKLGEMTLRWVDACNPQEH